MTDGTSNADAASVNNTANSNTPAWRRSGAYRKAASKRTFLRLTIIGAILAAALLLVSVSAPGQAAVTTLVSNTNQPGISGSTSVNPNDHAQAFTTGQNTLGYTLASIELDVGTAPGNGVLTVSVRAEASGSPGSTDLYKLNNPSNLGTGPQTFTAPASATLSANTQYFVHMTFAPSGSANQPQWKATLSINEDSGGAKGWSISNTRQLRATGSSGNWSNNSFNVIEIKVKGEILVPAAPGNLSAAASDGQVTLSWDDPGNDTITKYQYSIDGGTNFTDIGSSDNETTAYTVTNLTNGTQYTLAVRAVNDGGDGTASTVTATPATVPDAPTSLTATGADTSVTLAWTASVSDGGSAITMHQYRQKAGTDN